MLKYAFSLKFAQANFRPDLQCLHDTPLDGGVARVDVLVVFELLRVAKPSRWNLIRQLWPTRADAHSHSALRFGRTWHSGSRKSFCISK